MAAISSARPLDLFRGLYYRMRGRKLEKVRLNAVPSNKDMEYTFKSMMGCMDEEYDVRRLYDDAGFYQRQAPPTD